MRPAYPNGVADLKLAVFDSKLGVVESKLGVVGSKLAAFDRKPDGLESISARLGPKLAELEYQFAAYDKELEAPESHFVVHDIVLTKGSYKITKIRNNSK